MGPQLTATCSPCASDAGLAVGATLAYAHLAYDV